MMTTTSMLWIILTAQAADAVAQDKFAGVPERTIRVEMIEEPLDTPITMFNSVMDRPKYAATIVLKEGVGDTRPLTIYARTTRPESRGEKFQRETGLSGLSDAQRKIMKTNNWYETHSSRPTRSRKAFDAAALRFHRFMKEGTHFFTFYGYTKEDAQSVARAAIERLDADTRKKFDRTLQMLRERRETAAGKSARVAAAAQKRAEAQSRLDATRAVVPYANADQAAADVAELAKSLRQAEIEIAGMRAKEKAISGFKARDGIDVEARTMLDRMTMELDIELAGALARNTSLRRHRTSVTTSSRSISRVGWASPSRFPKI